MKINVIWKDNNVLGGGNQFLMRLKSQFIDMGMYSSVEDADIILYNSHHHISDVKLLSKKYKGQKLFIHRVDGPMRLYNNLNDKRDDIVSDMNRIADGTVFQSQWSKVRTIDMYPIFNKNPSRVILNACHYDGDRAMHKNKKIRLVAVSISDNIKKGYDMYSFLDHNLDFDKYDFSFIGKAPCVWSNINNLGVMSSDMVMAELVNYDIFITASENDPCSNSLLEAMSVGLPSIALNSGGHPEILKNGGLLFNTKPELLDAIGTISNNLNFYASNVESRRMEDALNEYVEFFKELM